MTKILLIDDDRLVLGTMARGLREAGYEVLETDTAAQALEAARREMPDLALVDVRLPDAHGLELVRRLRREMNVYSLVFTAYDDRALVDEAVREGILGYLVKPLDIPKIVPAIEAALEVRDELAALRNTKERLLRAQTINRNISVAIGIYMERFHVSQIEAFEALRAYARSERRKLADVAEELVSATDRRNELTNRIYQMEKRSTAKKDKSDKPRRSHTAGDPKGDGDSSPSSPPSTTDD